MSMEVGGLTPENVLVASGTTESISVSLHRLVVMNVFEHWARVKAQEKSPQQVIGALIGKQKGRHLEIMNSFELVFDKIENDIIIDKDHYNTKESQFKQVFSDLDFLGWYTIDDTVNESDIKIHKKICELNESPVFMKLNPQKGYTELPVIMYESVINLVSGEATMLLVELPYTLATEEAERIGLDHMARMSVNESGGSYLDVVSQVVKKEMLCHQCYSEFQVFEHFDKEIGCQCCSVLFCEKYMKKHTCSKCYDVVTGQMDALKNCSVSASQIGGQNEKDRLLAERLQKLKREMGKVCAPNKDEIRLSLARLKDVDPTHYTVPPIEVFQPPTVEEAVRADLQSTKNEVAQSFYNLEGVP